MNNYNENGTSRGDRICAPATPLSCNGQPNSESVESGSPVRLITTISEAVESGSSSSELKNEQNLNNNEMSYSTEFQTSRVDRICDPATTQALMGSPQLFNQFGLNEGFDEDGRQLMVVNHEREPVFHYIDDEYEDMEDLQFGNVLPYDNLRVFNDFIDFGYESEDEEPAFRNVEFESDFAELVYITSAESLRLSPERQYYIPSLLERLRTDFSKALHESHGQPLRLSYTVKEFFHIMTKCYSDEILEKFKPTGEPFIQAKVTTPTCFSPVLLRAHPNDDDDFDFFFLMGCDETWDRDLVLCESRIRDRKQFIYIRFAELYAEHIVCNIPGGEYFDYEITPRTIQWFLKRPPYTYFQTRFTGEPDSYFFYLTSANFQDYEGSVSVGEYKIHLRELQLQTLSRNDQNGGVLYLEPQSEDPTMVGDVNDQPTVKESVNVQLVETRGDKLAIPATTIQPRIKIDGFSIPPTYFPELTDRFNNLGTFNWSTSDAAGKLIKEYNIPLDIWMGLQNNPATLPLLQFQFWKPQIEIDFQLTSTQFHAGLLIAGVKYYAKTDSNTVGIRTPKFSEQLWSLDHATIRASGNSNAVLKIPFQSFLDIIPIREGNVGSSSYYATVYIGVASPLGIKEGNTTVTITAQMRLSCDGVQTGFYGQSTRAPLTQTMYLEPQGFLSILGIIGTVGRVIGSVANGVSTVIGGITKGVESLFGGSGKVNKTSNEDKPMLPLEATHLVEFPSVSLSHGVGPTIGRSMRLNPTMLTPHIPDTLPMGTTVLDNSIAQRWGYIGKFPISVSDPINKELYTLPITPMNYCSLENIGNAKYLPTPLAGIAGMYTYWSGTLKVKLIVAKANPQSIRLRLYSYPGPKVQSTNAVDTYSTVVDFNENTEVEYELPFFSPTKLIPTVSGENMISVGQFNVRLENLMTNISICPETIDVIVLMSASQDTKFAVPRPVLWRPGGSTPGPKFPFKVTVNYENKPCTEGCAGLVINGVRGNPGCNKELYTVATLSEFVQDFTNSGIMYFASTTNIIADSLVSQARYILNFVRREEEDPDWRGIVVMQTIFDNFEEILATAFGVNQVPDNVTFDRLNFRIPYASNFSVDVAYIGVDSLISQASSLTTNPQIDLENVMTNCGTGLRILEPQSEATEHDEGLGPDVVEEASHASTLIGEDFNLLDIVKRYRPVLHSEAVYNRGHYEMTFDLNYGSLSARIEGEPVSNLTWCHDGFRFGKGGLNYNITIDAATNPNVRMRLYHRPGGLSIDPTLIPAFTVTNPKLFEYGDYAHEIIATPTTSVPVHIPYYNYTNYLINGYDPRLVGVASMAGYSFGQAVLMMDIPVDDTYVSFTVHRSLGDDAQLYTFQGWPLCVNRYTSLNITDSKPFTPSSIDNLRYLRPQGEYLKPSARDDFVQQYMINHFGDCRRGRKALDKFFTRAVGRKFLQPQSEDELSDGKRLLVDKFMIELAKCYNNKVPISTLIPDFVRSKLDNDDVYQLFQKPDDEDLIVWRSILNGIANTVFCSFANISPEFYNLTKTSRPKSSWFSSIKILVSRTSSVVPSALKEAIKDLDSKFLGVPGTLMGKLLHVLSKLNSEIFNTTNIFLFVSTLQLIFMAREAWVKAMSTLQLLVYFGLLSATQMTLAFIICNMVKGLSPKSGYIYLQPQDASRTEVAEYASALLGGVAALAGFHNAKTWSSGIETFVKLWGTASNSWHLLLTKSCTFILDYIIYLFNINTPLTTAIAEMKSMNLDVTDWAQAVLEITEPCNHDKVLSSPSRRVEVATLYNQGSVFMKVVLEDKKCTTQVTSFLNLFTRISELYKETGETPGSVEANTCPISLWITGDPGVGKSEVAKTISMKLAALMGITYDGDPYFVRSARPYWDGYNSQPIIIFDDALQVSEPTLHGYFIRDWFGIMTSAPYSPEFANISEKKKFVTPKLVVVCSNQVYPRPSGVATPEAFNRRRDFLIKAEISEAIKTKYPDLKNLNDLRLSEEDLENFEHIQFRQYADVVDETSGTSGLYGLNEMVKLLYPKIDKLATRRLKSAGRQVKLSRALSPEHIGDLREELMTEISVSEIARSTAKSLITNMTTIMEPQCEENHSPVEPFVFNKINDDNCFYGCDTILKTQCFCQLDSKQIQHSRFCSVCGIFITPYLHTRVKLGFGDCDCKDADSKFDLILANVKEWFSGHVGGGLVQLPDFKNSKNETVTNKKFNFSKIAEYFSSKINNYWNKLPMNYFVPLVLTISLNALINCFIRFDTIKRAWSWMTNSSPELQPNAPEVDELGDWARQVYGTSSRPGLLMKEKFSAQDKQRFLKSTERHLNRDLPEGYVAGDRIGPWELDSSESRWIRTDWINMSPNMASSGGVKTKTIPSRNFKVIRAQDDTQRDLIDRIYRNRVHLTVTYSSGVQSRITGLGLKNRFILMPRHALHQCTSGIVSIDICLSNYQGERGGTITIKADGFKDQRVQNYDLSILEIEDRRLPQFRDITRAFVKEVEFNRVSRRAILCDVLGDDINRAKVIPIEVSPVLFNNTAYRIGDKDETFTLRGFSYPLEGRGMCGSILIDRIHGNITSIHTSGSDGVGYSTILCYDDFCDLVDPSGIIDIEEPSFKEGGKIKPKGDFLPLGKLLDSQCVTLPMKTNIAKSACHQILQEPARSPVRFIEPGEPVPGVTRLTAAFEKGGNPPLPWNRELVRIAVKDLTDTFIKYCKPVTLEVGRRNMQEAVCGIPAVPFMDPLKRNTSVGWPLCLSKVGTKKDNYFDLEETSEGLRLLGAHPEFVELYNINHNKRIQGIVPFSPYNNFLKDERLKPGKLPRLINGSPLDQTVEGRRYFMDFVSAVQTNGRNPRVGLAVGMNIRGVEWSKLAVDLLSKGESIACGDYSGFGPGLDPDLVLACGEIINAWYDHYQNVETERLEEDNLVRNTLLENFAFSHEINMDSIFQTLCGSPSGSMVTVIINSIVNLLYIRLAWLTCFQDTVLADLACMREHICMFVYGDDIIFSLSPFIKDLFNNKILSEIFARQNIKYTDADKSGNIRLYTSLAEATFLKCYFVPHPTRGPGFYLAALEKAMIQDIPNWIRTPFDDKILVSLDNCVEAIHLSYAWGKEYYNSILKQCTEYWSVRNQVLPDVRSWEYLDALYFGELGNIDLPNRLNPLNYAWY